MDRLNILIVEVENGYVVTERTEQRSCYGNRWVASNIPSLVELVRNLAVETKPQQSPKQSEAPDDRE